MSKPTIEKGIPLPVKTYKRAPNRELYTLVQINDSLLLDTFQGREFAHFCRKQEWSYVRQKIDDETARYWRTA